MPLITSSFRINFQFNLLILNMIFHRSHVIDLICNLIQFIMRWTRSNCMFIPFEWRLKAIVCCCDASSLLSSIARAEPGRTQSDFNRKYPTVLTKTNFLAWFTIAFHLLPHLGSRSAINENVNRIRNCCLRHPSAGKVQRDKWAGWTGHRQRERRMI